MSARRRISRLERQHVPRRDVPEDVLDRQIAHLVTVLAEGRIRARAAGAPVSPPDDELGREVDRLVEAEADRLVESGWVPEPKEMPHE